MVSHVVALTRMRLACWLLFTAILWTGCSGQTERGEIRLSGDPNKTILRIDGEAVAEKEIRWRLESRYSPLEIETADPDTKQGMIQAAVDELILDKLLLKAAQKTDLHVDSTEVDAAVQNARSMMGDERFEQMLAARYPSENDYREFVKEVLLIGRYEETLYPSLQVDEQGLEEFFERNKNRFMRPETVRLEVILVPDLTVADQIYSRLQRGEALEAVLDAYSAGEEKIKGRRMPWMPYDKIPGPLREAVRSGEAGEILGPIETSEGSTVIRILEKRAPHLPSLEEAREDVAALALKEQKHAVLQAWYDAARKSANIEYLK